MRRRGLEFADGARRILGYLGTFFSYLTLDLLSPIRELVIKPEGIQLLDGLVGLDECIFLGLCQDVLLPTA